MEIWNVYARPQSCSEEFVDSLDSRSKAMAYVRHLQQEYPCDEMDGIPVRYYARQEEPEPYFQSVPASQYQPSWDGRP